jgi:periplasmic protein TonB
MFTVLPESRAPRARRLGGTLTSVLVHGVLIAGAVALTMTHRADATVAPPTPQKPPVVFVVTEHPPQPDAPPQHGPAVARPEVRQPPTHLVDVRIPPTLPPIDPLGPTIAPEDVVLGRGGRAGIPSEGSARAGEGTALGSGGIVGEHETDRAPHVLGSAPQPRYPETLRAAGIGGHVVLQFVVDTLGRAELSTIEIQEATRPEFADAVRAALARFHFSAGEVAGRKVRTRVQIPFEFSLR